MEEIKLWQQQLGLKEYNKALHVRSACIEG